MFRSFFIDPCLSEDGCVFPGMFPPDPSQTTVASLITPIPLYPGMILQNPAPSALALAMRKERLAIELAEKRRRMMPGNGFFDY